VNIDPTQVKVSDLTAGYTDNGDEGVRGFGGLLNIRPAFQREFVYEPKERNAVIDTLRRGYPLNTMYWAVAGDGYELMDGQQRTISICQYVNGDFSVEFDGSPRFFDNLSAEKQKHILDYPLHVYVCDGTDDEKLEWFKTINIAGKPLFPQELRNAIYTGPWLADAKRWFSRNQGPAYQIGDPYIRGQTKRQDFLERALEWISGGHPEDYMSVHQHDDDAQELWNYYVSVIEWIERMFPHYRSPMKGLDWGRFYNAHKDDELDPAALEARVQALMTDPEVTSRPGIYEYVLTDDERTLNLRTFEEADRIAKYELQQGICPMCGPEKSYTIEQMEADHIIPWHQGGKTELDNCQMLCKMHNRTKSGK
jgi:hypothetical protein